MNKRAIAILGAIFILIVGTLGFIIWQRSSSKEDEQPEIVNTEPTIPVVIEEPEIEEPEQPAEGAVRLTDDFVISPILTFRGDGLSYAVRTGQIYLTDYTTSDQTVLLSNKREVVVPPKSGISKILWPLVGNSYMAELGSGLSKSWSLYNPELGSYVDIPPQVKALDWMPTGDKIVFVWVDESNKAFLNIADPDTNNYQVLTDLYEPDNMIHVSPDGKLIMFYRTQTANPARNTINSVTIDGKTFETVIGDGYNTGVTWSPDSTKFLFTKIDPSTRKSTLWMKNIISGELKSLGVNTSNEKAIWTRNSQAVVAAAPSSSDGSGQDMVYKIEISTGFQQTYDPGASIDIQNLVLSQSENFLFFINGSDNALYYLSL